MIDIARARRAHEMALRGLTIYAHAMEALGVPIGDAAQGALEAPGEATNAARPIVRHDTASPALAKAGRTAAAKTCARCGKGFTPHPQGAHRAMYCGKACRQNAAAQRRRDGEAAEDQRQAAAVMAQAERDEFPSTLSWRNGDGTS